MTSKFVRGLAVAAAAVAMSCAGAGAAAAAPEPAHDRFPCAVNEPCEYWRSADGLTYCSEGFCANYDKTGHFLCYSGADPQAFFCDGWVMPIARLLPDGVPFAAILGRT